MNGAERRNVQTVADVKARIETIKQAAGDPEAAHSMEDDLVAEVLFAIANQAGISGGKWAQEMASAARQVYRVEFPREKGIRRQLPYCDPDCPPNGHTAACDRRYGAPADPTPTPPATDLGATP